MTNLCKECIDLIWVDGNNWHASQVIKMNSMFEDCSNLKYLSNISGWDTTNMKEINYMFKNCSSVEEIDLSNWETSKLVKMQGLFYGCTNLKQIKGLLNWI